MAFWCSPMMYDGIDNEKNFFMTFLCSLSINNRQKYSQMNSYTLSIIYLSMCHNGIDPRERKHFESHQMKMFYESLTFFSLSISSSRLLVFIVIVSIDRGDEKMWR
jgi:hypothetical protein